MWFSEFAPDCVNVAFVRSLDNRCYPVSSVAAVPPQISYRQSDTISCLWWMLGLINPAPEGWFILSLSNLTIFLTLEVFQTARMSCSNLWRLKDFKCDLNLCTGPPINNETKWIELDTPLSDFLTDTAQWIIVWHSDGNMPDNRHCHSVLLCMVGIVSDKLSHIHPLLQMFPIFYLSWTYMS